MKKCKCIKDYIDKYNGNKLLYKHNENYYYEIKDDFHLNLKILVYYYNKKCVRLWYEYFNEYFIDIQEERKQKIKQLNEKMYM